MLDTPASTWLDGLPLALNRRLAIVIVADAVAIESIRRRCKMRPLIIRPAGLEDEVVIRLLLPCTLVGFIAPSGTDTENEPDRMVCGRAKRADPLSPVVVLARMRVAKTTFSVARCSLPMIAKHAPVVSRHWTVSTDEGKRDIVSPASKSMAAVFEVTRPNTAMKLFPMSAAPSPSSRLDVISSAIDLTVCGNLLRQQVVGHSKSRLAQGRTTSQHARAERVFSI